MQDVDPLSAEPTVRAILDTLHRALPRVALAVGIVLAGWLVARLMRALVRHVLLRWRDRQAARGQTPRWAHMVEQGRPGQIVGGTVYWTIMLVTVMTATEVLGLRVISAWLASVAGYIPRLAAAAVVIFAASIAGRLLGRGVVRAAALAGSPHAARLGALVRTALLAAAVLMGLQQLGIDVSLITTTFLIGLAAMVAGTALAFGLGARPFVSQILAMHYVNRNFRVGERIRIDDIEGRIIRFTPTSIILDTESGEASVPALDITTRPSFRLPREA
jgi:small-conductance mechanosensitive channel